MTAKIKHWQDPVNLALGLWMIVSPWALSYATETEATGNAVVVGALIAALALLALLNVMGWEEWVSVALGAWLAVSPTFLGFSGLVFAATWNAVIVGAVVAMLAVWTLCTDKDLWSPAT